MNHKGTIRLESERLILRQYELSDAPAMYKNWATDVLTTKYLTWEPHDSLMTTTEFLSGLISLYGNPQFYTWVIELKEENTVIGSVNLHSIIDRDERVELGYCLGSKWWNRGLMTEAVGMIIDFAFEHLGAHKVSAEYQEENVASGRVVMKNRMVFEGRLRSHLKNEDGSFSDILYYGILRDEWLEQKNR